MPRQTKSSGLNRRSAIGPKNKSKIMKKSWKEYLIFLTNMHHVVDKVNQKENSSYKQFPSKNINIDQPTAKIMNNSMAKGASKSSHVIECTSKGTKQPTPSSFENHRILVEIQKALSRSVVVGKAKLKEPHAERKGEANDASRPAPLTVMPGLVPNTTNRGQYGDLSTRSQKQVSFDKDITSAKHSIAKLEFPKGSCITKGTNKHDEIVIDNDKENVKFGEYHKEGDNTKTKHTLDSTLSEIHCSIGSISSCPFGQDLPKFQVDNHSMNLTFEDVENRGLTERNMGQFDNFNGKNSNFMSKKRKEPLFAENPKALDDDNDVGVQVDNMSCKQMKKLKQSKVTRKDEVEDGDGDLNHAVVEDDTATILKNDQAKVSMSSYVERQCYSCSKPIDSPTWSGIFKTNDKKYVSLDGHLSTKSCEKAWDLSKQLLKVVEVRKHSRLDVWPKAWKVSTPTSNDIGIYFFPHEMRQDEGLDQLVREVMQNDLALRTIIGEAEMLIFPSILLPDHHQTFQGKNYLWGVFKHREDKGALVEAPLSVVGSCEMEKQQNVVLYQPNHVLSDEEPNQEMIRMASVKPLERHLLPPNKSTQEVEASHLKGPTNKGFDLKAPGEEGGQAETTPTNAQMDSMGHIPDRLIGFVVRKTPKLDQIILEIEREGALVFAMQGETVGVGSWVISKATATQK